MFFEIFVNCCEKHSLRFVEISKGFLLGMSSLIYIKNLKSFYYKVWERAMGKSEFIVTLLPLVDFGIQIHINMENALEIKFALF